MGRCGATGRRLFPCSFTVEGAEQVVAFRGVGCHAFTAPFRTRKPPRSPRKHDGVPDRIMLSRWSRVFLHADNSRESMAPKAPSLLSLFSPLTGPTRHDVAHFRSPPERGRTRGPSSGAPGRRPGRPAGRSGALAHPPQGPRRPRQGRPAIRLHRRGGRRGGGKAPHRPATFGQSGPLRGGTVCRAAAGDAATASPPGRHRFRAGRPGGGVVPGGAGLPAAGAGARPGGARPHP